MPVAEMHQRISGPEFMEWMAFDRLYPISSEREDLRTSILAQTIAGAAGSDMKAEAFYKQLDFATPIFESITGMKSEASAVLQENSIDAMKHKLMIWAASSNVEIAKTGA